MSPAPGGAPAGGGLPRHRRSLPVLAAIVVAGLLLTAALVALGSWQVHRLAWKEDLIARVDRRLAAPPADPPPPAQWAAVDAARDEYRRVRLTGTFLDNRETLVQAVTAEGGGFWVMAPLRTADGWIVLVNRGFVPPERRDASTRGTPSPTGTVTVTGLLRLTEPGGGFLRRNDPAANRWFSRDVAGIAAARGLSDVAPYFVDADASPRTRAYPVGGLTVVAFPNNHLIYALTWYALALLSAGGLAVLLRHEWVSRHHGAAAL